MRGALVALAFGTPVALAILFLYLMATPEKPARPPGVQTGSTTQPAFVVRSWTSEPLFRIHLRGKEGFINRNGDIVIQPVFDNVSPFREGLASATLYGKSGYIDQKGQWVITPRFGGAGFFSDGLAVAHADSPGKAGYIDRTGTFVIEPQFDCAEPFMNGIACVGHETFRSRLRGFFADFGVTCDYFYINKCGEKVAPPVPPLVLKSDAQRSPLKPIRGSTGKMGFTNSKGEIEIMPEFDYVYEFENGLAQFTRGPNAGYINEAGRVIWEGPQ